MTTKVLFILLFAGGIFVENVLLLKIASFNIQNFRKRKLDNSFVATTLTEIVREFDFIFIQEILDGDALSYLQGMVNRHDPTDSFICDTGNPHGTYHTHMERYGYCYRPRELTVLESFEWNGTEFTYPPCALRLKPRDSCLPEFGFIGAHLRPSRGRDRITPREMESLYGVHAYLSKVWSVKNFILAGDFNADKPYMTEAELEQTSLRTNQSFEWFIEDGERTNLGLTARTYDRIIGIGDELLKKVTDRRVFIFKPNRAQARRVSDHYPVYITLDARSLSSWLLTELSRLSKKRKFGDIFSIFSI